jgi:hypothetical protein
LQAADGFSGENDTERITDFADFEFEHSSPRTL